uniref:hypothetical protein n=1 Tax=Sporochnus bolleanus TaxID=461143 RepID=UPI002E779779|nr:hypothetical protein V2496_pgp063 [Sporochnus bolleanus]WAM64885.1 hypothetical protein [Sporochnus bolleanus]
MCICLNCDRLNNCAIYFIVEQKHKEKRKGQFIEKFFFPQSPILLCINFGKNLYVLEWDVHECLSYQEKPGKWLSDYSKTLKSSSYLLFDSLF